MKLRLCVAMFLAAAVMLTATQSARATLFFSDGFNYPNGELTDHNDGTGPGANVSGGLWNDHSGANFPTSILVNNGQAVLKEGNPASEDANRVAGQIIGLGETWYYAATITVNDERASSATSLFNTYFMHFKDAGNNFRGRAYVDNPNAGVGAAGFTLGLSATGNQVVKWPVDLAFGTPYKIVGSYSVDTGQSQLWVNPTDISSPSLTDTQAGAALTAIESLALRQAFQGATFGPNYEVLVGAVALGSTFDEVCGALIPEPSTGLLALVSLVGLTLGSRRRSA